MPPLKRFRVPLKSKRLDSELFQSKHVVFKRFSFREKIPNPFTSTNNWWNLYIFLFTTRNAFKNSKRADQYENRILEILCTQKNLFTLGRWTVVIVGRKRAIFFCGFRRRGDTVAKTRPAGNVFFIEIASGLSDIRAKIIRCAFRTRAVRPKRPGEELSPVSGDGSPRTRTGAAARGSDRPGAPVRVWQRDEALTRARPPGPEKSRIMRDLRSGNNRARKNARACAC